MSDWRSRHPFKIGDMARPRHGTRRWCEFGPRPKMVTMRGEDAYGPWVCLDDDWQRHDAKLFELAAETKQEADT